jgi:hypothetical protein
MSLNIDVDSLKDNLFSAAKEATATHLEAGIDESKESYAKYLVELKDYTDNLATLKIEIAEAPDAAAKKVKMESIVLQQRAINSLVDRYQMIFQQEAMERVKEVLKTVAITAGKIALSMAIAAV